jgi:hypothetical protein
LPHSPVCEPRPPADQSPRTTATHLAAVRHKVATLPRTARPTTPHAPIRQSPGCHVGSSATPGTQTPTPTRPTDPTRHANRVPRQAARPPHRNPQAPAHPVPPTLARRPPTSSPLHPRVCAPTPTTHTPHNQCGAPPARCPHWPLSPWRGSSYPGWYLSRVNPCGDPYPARNRRSADRCTALEDTDHGQAPPPEEGGKGLPCIG